MPVYGIDLGTTYSCVARIDDTGSPVIIRNSLGEESTPSVVFFESPYQVVVGREAKNAAVAEAELVVSKIKREMGKRGVELEFHGETFTPEAISALILRDVVKTASESSGRDVQNVVITVPAYFGLAERVATRTAGVMAGLNVVNVVPEPVAAALYYGVLNAGVPKDVLVFDLGGGTFDTTVIRLSGQDVHVVCTDGDHELGGADWDNKIADYLCEQFMSQFPDSRASEDESFLQDLALSAEEVKKALTGRRSKQQPVVYRGLRTQVEITRDTLEQISAELLDRALEITRATMQAAAERGVERFDEVLLVGGSTRMPMIAAALTANFGFRPKMHEPDLAVAKGAALFGIVESLRLCSQQGELDSSARQSLASELDVSIDTIDTMAAKTVTIVVPRAFGIKTLATDDDGNPKDCEYGPFYVTHLLLPNTQLPASETKQFLTPYENQREINIEIWEQAGPRASDNPEDNNQIGDVAITRLPPLPKGSKIDVTFNMDVNGALQIVAQEKMTGQTVTSTIQIGDLSDDEVSVARRTVARLS
jgi:molecular chaperone DnaK